MTANTKENFAFVFLNTTFVDGIDISVSNPELSVLYFPCYMVFSQFF